MNKTDKQIAAIITTYNSVVKVIDKQAVEQSDRAYGGMIREVKGKLQEHIAEELTRIAWEKIGGKSDDIEINSKKIPVPILDKYIDKISDSEVRTYIQTHKTEYNYGLSVDKHIFIRNRFVMGIECKAYTENAMIKRILVDFSLLKTIYPQLSCWLFQLENQMGGDYSQYILGKFGSKPTHTIMSYFNDVNLKILTLLEGDRMVNKPIHKYFKPLRKERLEEAIEILANELNQFI